MTQPISETTAAAPPRKPPETLPIGFFPLLARNIVVLRVVGGAGVIGSLAFFVTSAAAVPFGDLPPSLARLLLAVRFFSAALMMTPSIHLLRYQAAIAKAVAVPDSDGLTLILRQQLRFWRFVGMALIVAFTLIAAVILAPYVWMFRDRNLS